MKKSRCLFVAAISVALLLGEHSAVFVLSADELPVRGPELALVQGRYYGSEREIAFSADGDLLVTVGAGGVTKLWHVPSGNILRDFDTARGSAMSARFDPQGQRLAIGTWSGSIEIVAVATGDQLSQMQGAERVETLDWSTDGRALVSASRGLPSIDVWDTTSGELMAKLEDVEGSVKILRFQPVGDLLAAAHAGGIDLWDVTARHRRSTLRTPAEVIKMTWSNDGRQLAGGDRDGRIRVWDIATLREIAALELPTEIGGMAFRDRGRQLVVGSGLIVSVYDLTTSTEVKRYEIARFGPGVSGYNFYIRSFAMAPNGRTLAFYGGKGGLQLFDLERGEARSALTRIASGLEAVAWSPDGLSLASGGDDGVIRVRDLATGEIRHLLPGHRDHVRDLAFTPDSDRLLSSGDDGKIAVWSLVRGGGRERSLPTPSRASHGEIPSIAVSPNGRVVAGGVSKAGNSTIYVSDISTGETLQTFVGRSILAVAYAQDRQTLLVADSYGGIVAWQAEGAFQTLLLPGPDSMAVVTALAPSPNGRLFAHPNFDLKTKDHHVVEVRSLEDGSLKQTLRGHHDDVWTLTWSPDGQILASGSKDFTIKLWYSGDWGEIATLRAHRGPVTDLAWSPDGRWLASVSADGTLRLWETARHELQLSILDLDAEGGSVVFTPDDYYMATTDVLGDIVFSLERESYPFDQFDLLRNRPDLVLTRLPHADPERVEAYRRAHAKRLSFLGFKNEPGFREEIILPRLEVLNQSRLPARTTDCSVELDVRASSVSAPLARVDVWVNDVPAFGSQGLGIGDSSSEVGRSLRVELGAGENHLQVSATDRTGLESRRWNRRIVCEREASPRWHVVAIGVSRYRDQSMNLGYAAKDASDLAQLFASSAGPETEPVEVHLLTDAAATREAILGLRKPLSQTTIDDKVLLLFAGHGVLTHEADYFLAPTDTDFSRLEETALSFRDLEALIDGIPARTRVLLIDACHAGEPDPELAFPGPGSLPRGVRLERGPRPRGARPLPAASDTFSLMHQLFGDLRRRTGATVIASSSGYQAALEADSWRNGVFSYSVLSGLTESRADLDGDGRILLSELRRHVYAEVPKLTGGVQHPSSRLTNLRLEVQLWPLEASSPGLDRRRLLLARDTTLEIAPLPAGEPRKLLVQSDEALKDFRFAPDGSWFVTLDGRGAVQLRDGSNGKLLRFEPVGGNGVALSVGGGGIRIATGGSHARAWDPVTGRLRSFEGRGPVALSSDGRVLAAVRGEGEIALWDTDTGELLRTLPANGEPVRALCFTGDGEHLVVGTANRVSPAGLGGAPVVSGNAPALRLWNLKTGAEAKRLPVSWVVALACAANGSRIAATELTSRLLVADTQKEGDYFWLGQLPGRPPERYKAVDLSPDGRLVAATTDQGETQVWDVATKELVAKLPGSSEQLPTIRFHPAMDTPPPPPEALRQPLFTPRPCRRLGAAPIYIPARLQERVDKAAVEAGILRAFIDRSLGVESVDLQIWGLMFSRRRLSSDALSRLAGWPRAAVGADCVLGGSIVTQESEDGVERLALELTVIDLENPRYIFQRLYGIPATEKAATNRVTATVLAALLERIAPDLDWLRTGSSKH